MANAILVTGSTGNVGSALVQELISAGENVRAAQRNPSGRGAIAFDYANADTFTAAVAGVDRIFVMAPPGHVQAHKLMLPFIEFAAREDRKFVLMTASGVEYDDRLPLRQVELYVQRCARRSVFLRPNWFMDNFHTAWLPFIRNRGILPVPAGDARSAFIAASDIAACAAAALRTASFDGGAFALTGPEALTYAEAASVLSRAAGREIRYESVADTEFAASLKAAGVPPEYAEYLTRLFGFVRQGQAAVVTDGVRTITGRPPRTLGEYAAEHASAWK